MVTEQGLELWVNHQVQSKLTEALESHRPAASKENEESVQKLKEFSVSLQKGLATSQKLLHEARKEASDLKQELEEKKGKLKKLL